MNIVTGEIADLFAEMEHVALEKIAVTVLAIAVNVVRQVIMIQQTVMVIVQEEVVIMNPLPGRIGCVVVRNNKYLFLLREVHLNLSFLEGRVYIS